MRSSNSETTGFDLTYKRHIPGEPLRPYIEDLYYFDGPPPHPRLKVLPMPSLNLMVNLGRPFRFSPMDVQQETLCTESWWVGIWSTYHVVEWPQQVRFFGVHFKPGGVYPFLKLPLSELHNQVVPLDSMWGTFANQIREQLYEAPSVEAGFTLLEHLLCCRLGEAPYGLDVVEYGIGEIARQCGQISILSLSDQIGISQNHLSTQFKRMVGITPKELARFYRFAHVLHSIDPAQQPNWMMLAHRCGYYDQSHFNKDFFTFTGHTPTDYLRLRQRLSSEHPEQSQNIGQLPTD